MRASVASAWPAFCESYEGKVPNMYLDTLRLVTFGIGRLIDANGSITDHGRSRPWRSKKTGDYVLESEIVAEFKNIKSHTELAPKGGFSFGDVSTLYVDDSVIRASLMDTTEDFWAVLKSTLPDLEEWPADAQMALMDMAWHMGPRFLGSSWPNFTKAAKAGNFYDAAQTCSTANNTPRDARHKNLYLNAAKVVAVGGDLGKFYDKAVLPEHSMGGALLAAISTAKVKTAANGGATSKDAWYVQRMLQEAGFYKSTLDGQFGKISNASLDAYFKSKGLTGFITKANLKSLANDTFRMGVTD